MSAADRQIDDRPDVSVVLVTYNRPAGVNRALDSVFTQRSPGRRYEVIVVDNNSTDNTRAEIERRIATSALDLRYVLERRQGVSYARNAGIGAARAPIVAFLDDDVCVDEDWIETICRVFERHPEVDCIGGRVLPVWEAAPPRWLTRNHWAPLALLDHGDAPRAVNGANRLCLLSANLACRRTAFERAGLFATELQRVKDGIGSMEDHEWLARFWAADGQALYVPELRASTEVPRARMTKAYHRRWHAGHGHYYALMRDPDFERSQSGRLFDLPAHAYRAALGDAYGWTSRLLRGDADGAFLFETRLRFFAGFFRTRLQHRVQSDGTGRIAADPL